MPSYLPTFVGEWDDTKTYEPLTNAQIDQYRRETQAVANALPIDDFDDENTVTMFSVFSTVSINGY